ncbi:GrpB-like predicted nucleotidyltransferase (UPF0157 family) [Tamaricihabitans halophyticus]|uniref:GrpB-like predicted nucleotidyltransferase (UPF0157 family) n=1 Tax=Tamaricihabitans halophyticus TaxID=1262583 RepID=A0A4R2R381_9PSEU|nr:GrpB family protein [Tamaricihabitans halophyticus]TCP57260.1 GrpB-like predicted nucleotidyltransferase (UPF0157 family) [Tamaricihabitans halophyticus]
MSERGDQLREIYIGEPPELNSTINLVDYDPAWPASYDREAARIRAALGDQVVRLEHVGSTSVPGLCAKPILDILLTVPDSAAEQDYVPALQAAGYRLTIREPDWYEHRLCKGPDTDVNLHIFSADSPEPARMLAFRDHLRANSADRERYAATKRELAARTWQYTQLYADAKDEVVADIMSRAAN